MPESPYELLVVGGGVAGLTAALTAAEEGARVLVVSKGPLLASASYHAQGGVAAALEPGDSPELHLRDTIEAGRSLCRESAARVLTGEAAERIDDLRAYGVRFDDEPGLEGGHSRRRVLHVDGADTGRRISETLALRALEHRRIDVAEGERVVSLLPGDGVRTDRRELHGRTIVLAAGGYAALWSRTTNPPGSVGEGIAMAHRAGAAVADLEFVQFHPTALAGTGFLLSEALRGEGALLLDRDGQQYADELAPRDVVAREVGARGSVLLDLRPVDRTRFPSLMRRLEEAGYDPGAEPVPIAPAAHYTMGGVVTDVDGRTDVPGLYAAGECACTGVHGANRLASNSLLECLVFGRRAALAAVHDGRAPSVSAASTGPLRGQEPRRPRRPSPRAGGTSRFPQTPSTGPLRGQELRRLRRLRSGSDPGETDGTVSEEVRREVWEHAGLVRDGAGLERLRRSPSLLARLVAECALARRESRGGHFRADFPRLDPSLDGLHTVIAAGRAPALERWS